MSDFDLVSSTCVHGFSSSKLAGLSLRVYASSGIFPEYYQSNTIHGLASIYFTGYLGSN